MACLCWFCTLILMFVMSFVTCTSFKFCFGRDGGVVVLCCVVVVVGGFGVFFDIMVL